MKNNSPKILLIVSLIFLVFCCSIFYILNREINLNKTVSEENELKWKEEVTKVENIKLLNNSIKKIETEKDLLETHIANGSNIVPFLDTMESLGKEAGVSTEVTLVDIPKESKSLVVEMNASGSFEKIYKFLLLLENSPYQLETISMDIEKENSGSTSKKNSVLRWKADLKIKLLSFIQ